MVKLPNVVAVETAVVNGQTVVKQMYADGSYGVDRKGSSVEIHYPNKDLRVFKKKDASDYYLAEEFLADKTVRRYDSKENMVYEKLPKGVERTWKVVNDKRFLEKEIIPGEVKREYGVTGKPTRFGRNGRGIIRGTEKHYLSSETFPNGLVKVYSSDGCFVKEIFPDNTWKKYDSKKRVIGECLADGTVMTYREDGKPASYTSPDGKTERTWYWTGQIKSEKLPDGTEKEWTISGKIAHEVRKDKTVIDCEYDREGNLAHQKVRKGEKVVDYKYDKNGNVVYHAVNGVEDTITYLAIQKVASRQAEKATNLRAQNEADRSADDSIAPVHTVKKLNPLQKAIAMQKAMREVKKDLNK